MIPGIIEDGKNCDRDRWKNKTVNYHGSDYSQRMAESYGFEKL
jgi:hypothetical protein